MNLLPTFDGVSEENFNSVMRRALVIRHYSRFVDRSLWLRLSDAQRDGIFPKDPDAKDFVRTGAASVAIWKVLHGHMHSYTTQECADAIERYVDGDDKGLTRRSMRFACGLSVNPGQADSPDLSASVVPDAHQDPVDACRRTFRKETNALICYMIENDMESISEAQLRLITGDHITGTNPEQRRKRFKELVHHGLHSDVSQNDPFS